MPTYIYNGNPIEEERINNAAQNLNISVEDYLKEYNFEVIADTPENFQPSVEKPTDLAQETADTGSKDLAVDMDLNLEDGSSELPEPTDPIKKKNKSQRYAWITPDSGKPVYEKDYLNNFAGKTIDGVEYPESFDDYASSKGKKVLSHNGTNKKQEAAENAITIYNDLGVNVWANENDSDQLDILQSTINSVVDSPEEFKPIFNPQEEIETSTRAIDMQFARDLRTQEVTVNAINDALSFYQTNMSTLTGIVMNKGVDFLDTNQKKLFDLQKEQRREFDNKKKKELQVQIDELRTAPPLFHDANTGDLVAYEQSSYAGEATDKAISTEKNVLEEELTKDYYSLVGLAKDIINAPFRVGGKGATLAQALSVLGESILEGDQSMQQKLKDLEEVASGNIPAKITYLPGDDPLSIAFNNSLDQWLITNAALQLNEDYTQTTPDDRKGTLASSVYNFLGLDVIDAPLYSGIKKAEVLYGNMAEAGFKPAEKYVNIVAEALKRDTFEYAGEAAPLAGMMLEAYVTGNLAKAGYTFVKGFNIIQKTHKFASRAYSGIKSPLLKKSISLTHRVFTSKAAKEAATFGAGGYLFGGVFRPESQIDTASDVRFGAAMGTTSAMASAITNRISTSTLFGKFSPILQKAYANWQRSKVLRNEPQRFRDAAIGGINLQIVEAALNHEEYVNSIRGIDGEIDYGLLYSSTVGEILKLYFLGKATPFWRSGFLFDWRADVLAKSGRTKDGQAARKKLVITNQESPEAVETKLREIETQANELIEQGLVKDGAQLKRDVNHVRHEELLKEAKQILKDEKIEGGQSSLSVTPTEILEVVNAVKRYNQRGKLTMRESAILAKIPPGILAERLGLDPNSREYKTIESFQQWHLHINEALDSKHGFYGATFTLPADALAARQRGYEFFTGQADVALELDGLLAKPTPTDDEKNRIKELQGKLKQYEPGGEKFNEFAKIADDAAATAISKDIAKAKETGVDQIIEAKTKDQFQAQYDKLKKQKPGDIGYEDVKNKVAVIVGNTKIINFQYAKEVKNFNPTTHEIIHELGVVAALRNPDGITMSPQGIEIIDGILNSLTPRQRKLVDLRLERSGVHLDKNGQLREKMFWYEEHLAHIGELMADGQIQYTESLGTQLLNFVPGINKTFNIPINGETAKGVYNMLVAVAEGKLTPEQNLATLKDGQSFNSQELIDLQNRYANNEITEDDYIRLSDEILFGQTVTEFEITKTETKIENGQFAGTSPKSLIQIIKNPQSTNKDVREANAELREQYKKLAIGAIKSRQAKAGGFDIEKNPDLIQDLMLEYEGIVKRYDGSTEFSTYVNATIRPKYPMYVEKYKIESEVSSYDDVSQGSSVRQLADNNDRTSDPGNLSDYSKPFSLIKPKSLGLNQPSQQVLKEKTADLITEGGVEPGTYTFADFPIGPGAEAVANQLGIPVEKITNPATTLNYGYNLRVTYTDANGKKTDKVIRKSTWDSGFAEQFPDAKIIEFQEPETYKARRLLKLLFKNGLGKIMPPYTSLPYAGKEAKDPTSPAYRPGMEKAEIRGGLINSRTVIQEFYVSSKDAPSTLFGQTDSQYSVSEARWQKNQRQEGPAGAALLKYANYSYAEITKILDAGLEENRPEGMSDKEWDKVQKRNAQLMQGLLHTYSKLATMSEYTAQIEGNPYDVNSYNWGKNQSMFNSEQVRNSDKRSFTFEFSQQTTKKGLQRELKAAAKQIREDDQLQNIHDSAFEAFIKGPEAFDAYIDNLSNKIGPETANTINNYFANKPWLHAVYAHKRLFDKDGKGYEFEEFITYTLNALGIKDAKVKLEGGNNSKTVDIVWEIDGESYNLELKLDTNAPLTSFTISEKSVNYQKIKNLPQITRFVESLNTRLFTKGEYAGLTFNAAKNKMYSEAIEYAEANNYAYRKILDDAGNIIGIKGDFEIFKYIQESGRQASLEVKEDMPIDLAIELFRSLPEEQMAGDLKGKSQVPTKNYVVFGDYGMYALDAANNPFGAPILEEQFPNNPNPISIRQRFVRNSNIIKGSDIPEYYYAIRVQPFFNAKPKEMGLNLLDANGVATAVQNVRASRMFSSEMTVKANEHIFASKPEFAPDVKINKAQAIVRGNEVDAKNKFAYLSGKISPENNDFLGLLYDILPAGEAGNAQKTFYKQAFVDPYNRAYNKLDNDKLKFAANFKQSKKTFNVSDNRLQEKIEGTYFRTEDAIRVYIWTKQGHKIPELTESEQGQLLNYVKNNGLQDFAESLNGANGSSGWGAPEEYWISGGLKSDIAKTLKGINRPIRLEEWQQNVNDYFTEDNLNKMQAAYGTRWRVAMQNSLDRQRTGENRYYTMDSQVGAFADQLSGAILNTLNFNNKSALLQLTSSTNFINWTDNNPIEAAKAFANQKQYWKDFVYLWNSDFLKERRSGLTMELNEADIAELASGGGYKAFVAKMLKLGMAPTVLADNLAIDSPSFYRNRANRYMREGMEKSEAERRALEDWRETAETSQQSSRPDKISMNQAGPLGRVVLAYTNTPQQYMREMQKSLRDIKNNRGDYKTNVSKVLYYGFMQNFIFTGLQQGVNSVLFDDEEIVIPDISTDAEFKAYLQTLDPRERGAKIAERKQQLVEIKTLEAEQKKKIDKELNTINSMLDTSMKGLGLYGQVLSTVKNAGFRAYLESNKDRPDYRGTIPASLLAISPGLSVKYSQLQTGIGAFQYNWDEIKARGLGDINNPAYIGAANIIAGTTNMPLNRWFTKHRNIQNAMNEELATSTRVLSFGGWSEYSLGIPKEKWVGISLEDQIKFEDWTKQRLQELDPITRGLWISWKKEYDKKQKEKNKK